MKKRYRRADHWLPAGVGGSNPRSHQKTMLLDLSKLFIQSLLGRHAKFLQIFNLSTAAAKLLI